jgi:hypothetical protein
VLIWMAIAALLQRALEEPRVPIASRCTVQARGLQARVP